MLLNFGGLLGTGVLSMLRPFPMHILNINAKVIFSRVNFFFFFDDTGKRCLFVFLLVLLILKIIFHTGLCCLIKIERNFSKILL